MKIKSLKLLFLISLLSLSSCSKGYKTVSIFIYNEHDTFINYLKDHIVERLRYDYAINSVSYAEESQLVQNEQIVDTFVDKKTDLLLVNLVDRLATSSIVEKAKLENKPVIFFNREPLVKDLKGQKLAYYVGTSAKEEGEMQAELVKGIIGPNEEFIKSKYDKNKDGKLGVVYIKGSLGHQDSELRSKYALSTLTDFGYDVKVVSTLHGDWSKDVAYKEFKSLYKQIKDEIEVIISGNDDMAIGAIEVLKEQSNYDINKKVVDQYFPIIGMDATKVGIKAIEDGDMSETIVNDAFMQSIIIKDLVDVLLNKDGKTFANFEHKFDDENFIHCKPKRYDKNA